MDASLTDEAHYVLLCLLVIIYFRCVMFSQW